MHGTTARWSIECIILSR